MASKLFVGNLNFKTTREDLETLFSQAGEIKEVFIPTERETGRARGFAFVEFVDEAAAKAAIERFNGYELGGRQLRVNAAEDRPRGPRPQFGGGGGGGQRPGFSGGGGGNFGSGGAGDSSRDYYGNDRFGGGKPKGSRRNIRAKKRGL